MHATGTAFVIGHTDGKGRSKDQGAYSPILQATEFNWHLKHLKQLQLIGDVFMHDSNLVNYIDRQRKTARLTTQYKQVFELHFNASRDADGDGDGDGSGCEALHNDGNLVGEQFAINYCQLVNKHLGIKIRRKNGAIPVINGRGAGFIKLTGPTAVVLEPGFGDNINDATILKHSSKEYFGKVLPELIGVEISRGRLFRKAIVITG
ncbi:MAG: hypothetical protein R3279_05390 [Putridiphycobacter sp.]|nr:hypothetical protein [Putridiphycobacter sp.]